MGTWTEANLVLAEEPGPGWPSPALLPALRYVVAPLVSGPLRAQMVSWHFGCYKETAAAGPQLRLRVLWKDREPAGFAVALDLGATDTPGSGVVAWFRGAHGVLGRVYEGEEDEYGLLWVPTYRMWKAQSDWALALLLAHDEGRLPAGDAERPTGLLYYHWERCVHLATNRLGLPYPDEVWLALTLASGYLRVMAAGQQHPGWVAWARALRASTRAVAGELAALVPLSEKTTEGISEEPA
jgi:hypothetical protein